MREIDRREFVVSLAAAAAATTLFGSCRGIDPSGLFPGLQESFGEHEAWDKLGIFWLRKTGVDRDEMLADLARRLGWRPEMATEDLVTAILAAMEEDFDSGRIGTPGGWGLAETELAIYAVLSREPTPEKIGEAESAR